LRNIGLEQDKALKRQGEEITAIEQLNEGLRGRQTILEQKTSRMQEEIEQLRRLLEH